MFSNAGHALLYVPDQVLHLEDEGERVCCAALTCFGCAFISDVLSLVTLRHYNVRRDVCTWWPMYSLCYPCIIVGYEICGYKPPNADTYVEPLPTNAMG